MSTTRHHPSSWRPNTTAMDFTHTFVIPTINHHFCCICYPAFAPFSVFDCHYSHALNLNHLRGWHAYRLRNTINKGKFFEKRKINLFQNCKIYIVWNSFICRTYFNLAKIFVSRLFWMTAQSAPCVNKSLSLKFWWLRSANCMKFTEKQKEKKSSQMCWTCLPQGSWVEKTNHKVETLIFR